MSEEKKIYPKQNKVYRDPNFVPATLPENPVRMKKMKRIENLFIIKNMSPKEIAEEMGMTTTTVNKYLRELNKRWRYWAGDTTKKQRNVRARQYDEIYQKSMEAFEASKDGGMAEVKRSKMIPCPSCGGKGVKKESYCQKCDGEGEIVKYTKTYEHQDLPGDPSYLQSATKALNSVSNLLGLNAPAKKQIRSDNKTQILSAHISNSPLAELPPEVIHEIMAKMHEDKIKEQGQKLIEGRVVDDQ